MCIEGNNMKTDNISRAVAKYSPYGIAVVNKEGKIIFFNEEASGIWKEDLHIGDYLPEWLCMKGRKESYVSYKDRRTITVKKFRTTIMSELCTILFMTDISSELSDSNELYICKKSFDAITDLGMMAIDTEGRIVLYNEPSAIRDGLNRDAVLGKDIRELFVHDGLSTQLEVLRTGEPVIDKEVAYTNGLGKKTYCFGSTYPIKKDGRMIGAISVTRFDDSIKKLLERTMDLQTQLSEMKSQKGNGTRYTFDSIIGDSKEMQKALDVAKKASPISAPVLIYGETGTGKELIAQSIHNGGARRNEPFVAINCAAIPENLLESTLFGTTEGAFTGAKSRKGLFEQAGKGTLFLDELNSMPMSLQSKLLRVIQEKKVRRVGGSDEVDVKCRVISSCNQPPLECVKNETIREDLYYRLAVICVEIPPLRERTSDIVQLAESFLLKYKQIYGAKSAEMTDDFKSALCLYDWPGNVRELQHVIESTVVQLDPGEKLDSLRIPYNIRKYISKNEIEQKTDKNTLNREKEIQTKHDSDHIRLDNLHEQLESYERKVIIEALNQCRWNVTQTAKLIGYSRSNLQYRMGKLGITR